MTALLLQKELGRNTECDVIRFIKAAILNLHQFGEHGVIDRRFFIILPQLLSQFHSYLQKQEK